MLGLVEYENIVITSRHGHKFWVVLSIYQL